MSLSLQSAGEDFVGDMSDRLHQRWRQGSSLQSHLTRGMCMGSVGTAGSRCQGRNPTNTLATPEVKLSDDSQTEQPIAGPGQVSPTLTENHWGPRAGAHPVVTPNLLFFCNQVFFDYDPSSSTNSLLSSVGINWPGPSQVVGLWQRHEWICRCGTGWVRRHHPVHSQECWHHGDSYDRLVLGPGISPTPVWNRNRHSETQGPAPGGCWGNIPVSLPGVFW